VRTTNERMSVEYGDRLTAYARYEGLAVHPQVSVENNACYAPVMIGNTLLVGDMWVVRKWGRS
jgi:hypothetical protein